MNMKQKTVVVTGASQGIGAAVANLFLDRGYNVVGNSRKITHRNELQSSKNLALVDGDIGLASTAEMIVATAVKRFGSVDALVNNAGIFFSKPFTEYTPEDFRALSSPMITKGGINAISRNLAMEYAPQGIRLNVVAPGVVDTPLNKDAPKDFLRTTSPLGQIAGARDIAEAVLYLTEASQVTGEVLHVDCGAHLGRW